MLGRTVRSTYASIVPLATLTDASTAQQSAPIIRRDTYWLGAELGVGSAAGERHLLGAGLGVAVVDGCRGGGVFSNCRDVSAVIGLPLELQAFWRPGEVVGLGLYGFANLNRTRSFAGLSLSLQVGLLR